MRSSKRIGDLSTRFSGSTFALELEDLTFPEERPSIEEDEVFFAIEELDFEFEGSACPFFEDELPFALLEELATGSSSAETELLESSPQPANVNTSAKETSAPPKESFLILFYLFCLYKIYAQPNAK